MELALTPLGCLGIGVNVLPQVIELLGLADNVIDRFWFVPKLRGNGIRSADQADSTGRKTNDRSST